MGFPSVLSHTLVLTVLPIKKKKKKLISLGEGNLDTIHISLPDKQKRVVVVGGGRVCITCNKSVRLDVLLALALAVVP